MHSKKRNKILIMLLALTFLIGTSVPTTVAYISGKAPTIKNIFVPVKSPEHDFDIMVTGEKKLIGRDWEEGDAFSFQVQTWEVNKWTNVGTASVTYDKGDEDFNKFDVSDIVTNCIEGPGKYSFRIAETKGNDENIKYDSTACRFDITVTADETEAMDITDVENVEESEVSKDETSGDYTVKVSFTNEYEEPYIPPEPEDPEDITLDFVVDKTVKNTGEIEIGPKGFEFMVVKNSTGEEWTAEVDETGYAAFEMTYTKDDIGKVYLYELSEVDDGVDGVTYSDKVYDISVGIELSEDNELFSTIMMDGKAVNDVVAEFENIYAGAGQEEPTEPSEPEGPTKPDEPTKPAGPEDAADKVPDKDGAKDDGSKTGDDMELLPVIAIMIACLAVIAAVVISGRRKKS